MSRQSDVKWYSPRAEGDCPETLIGAWPDGYRVVFKILTGHLAMAIYKDGERYASIIVPAPSPETRVTSAEICEVVCEFVGAVAERGRPAPDLVVVRLGDIVAEVVKAEELAEAIRATGRPTN